MLYLYNLTVGGSCDGLILFVSRDSERSQTIVGRGGQ